jgi:hypothetical protein
MIKKKAIIIRIKIDIKILTCHFAIFEGPCIGIEEMREKKMKKRMGHLSYIIALMSPHVA